MKSKKEIKEAYKQQTFPMGVFQVKNLATGKVLIDHSTNMPATWRRHTTELNFGTHRNKALQQDWNELGADHFAFEVLLDWKPEEDGLADYTKELKQLQRMLLQELNIPEEGMY